MGYPIPGLPDDLLTSKKEGIRRLQVDFSQTGFFDGRQFRTFKELSIPTTSTYVIKAVVPVNTILLELSFSLDNSSVRVRTTAAGTSGGTFAETLPVFNANNMSGTPAYAHQNVLTAGGTLADGVDIDIIRIFSGVGNAASVGNRTDDARGVAPATYHFLVENIGAQTATGVMHLRWEERP